VEHIECQLFSGFPIAGDPHDQGEHESLRLREERMQSKLVASGDGLDESDPDLLGYGRLRPIGIEQITEGWPFTRVLAWLSSCIHCSGIMASLPGRVKKRRLHGRVSV
jgi:hypothetical protein